MTFLMETSGTYKLPLAGTGTSTSMYYKVLIHEPRVHKDPEVGNKVFRCEEGYFPNLPPPTPYQVDASAAPGTEDTETEGASGTLLASLSSSALTSHPLLLKQEHQGVPWKALTPRLLSSSYALSTGLLVPSIWTATE